MTAVDGPGITADVVYQRAVAEYGEDNVGAEQLGIVYQQMMSAETRVKRAAYYTPEQVAESMARFVFQELALDKVGPAPEQVMRICAIDPACGAGIFLVHAARQLSIAYATRLLAGAEPSGDLVFAVMPRVILNCVFGVDLDPVAVDLARLAVSLETAGTLTPAMLEGHIIVGNVLEGDLPPAYPVPNPPESGAES